MRRRLPLVALAAVLALPLSACTVDSDAPSDGTLAPAAAGKRHIDLTGWDRPRALRQGRTNGAVVRRGRVTFDSAAAQRTVAGTGYDVAAWVSPWTSPGFDFTELIASWSARTKGASWIEIQVRGRDTAAGSRTSWDVLGRWSTGDRRFKRRSVSGQDDDGTRVNVDTWQTAGLTSYQIRVKLMRRSGTSLTPSVDAVNVMTSRIPDAAGATSRPGPAAGKVLAVPRYSQMIHRGHFPQWGNGGEAWCSPTSMSMVLGYYDALPAAKRYAFVGDDHPDPWVDYAARMTYDYAYEGTGNWPFTTAYGAAQAGKGFVTRLRSLREAERFIVAGIPLVVSIAFDSGQLDGAPISASGGHLLVISGFTRSGNVIVNDPAAATNDGVRRTYRRDQFERIWLEASGGTTYVVRDGDHPLPGGRHSNW